jgi:16S rRNA (uracil1498-N3)-methyltransferase
VQKLTEIGVDRIVPLVAERTVVRWHGDRATKHETRLRKVAREAAMQSRRVWLPAVLPVTPVGSLVEEPQVALAQFGGRPPDLARPTVLVGPEGGWTDAEVAAAAATTTLGAGVLRAETAALAAGVLLTALRAGITRAG